MDSIEKRALGQTNLMLSPLGLGCWQFSKGGSMIGRFWPTLEDQDIQQIVQSSIAGGINWFDTAEIYGKGESERILAKSLDQLGEQANGVHIATKWWPMFRTAGNISKTIHKRNQALNNRTIDLYQIHQPFSYSSVRKEMEQMAKLKAKGLIRHIGVSNFNANAMREAHAVLKTYGYPLASNQVKYSLLDRRVETNGVLETAKELGISLIAYSPLEQGLLTGKFHKDPSLSKNASGPRKHQRKFKQNGLNKSLPLIDLLDQLADEYQVSTSQIALNWMINQHGSTVFAIPGASKVKHAEENIGALSFQLQPFELEEISKISWDVLKK
jgi:aryl-alcohol dehydrogenase-like predicted oxidoreductase